MSQEAAIKLIKTSWLTAWTTGGTPFPVEQQNLKFEQPENSAWGRLTIKPGETTSAALGAKFARTPFIVFLQVFIPEDGGTLAAYRAADVMRALDGYNVQQGGITLRFQTCGCEPVPSDLAGFDSFNVTMPGSFDIRA